MMRRKRALESLDQDIREHIDQETRDNIERGMSPEEARQAALRKFGSITIVKEDTRAVWIPIWIEQALQDARYSLRLVRRNPGFSAVVILTVALGIGMNTAVFSVINAVLLRPLSYPDSERLLSLSTQGPGTPFGDSDAVAPTDFADWREQASSFEKMVAYGASDVTITTAQDATRAQVASVTDDFWELSGAHPALGRIPKPNETDVFLVSHGFFERWFHGDPKIVGSAVMLNGRQVVVTGVLPNNVRFQLPVLWGRFDSSKEIDGYTSAIISPAQRARQPGFGGTWVNVVAKLKPGISIQCAKTELEAIRARIAQANPGWRPNQAKLVIVPVQEKLVGHARLALCVLLAAAVFVLLIACANVASLLLARASVRRREIAIRASVGAGPGRVARQFLVDSTVLGLVGGAAGLLLARWSLAIAARVIPRAVPRLTEVTFDRNVLLFALCASILTAILFGAGPAISLRKADVLELLEIGGRTSSASSGSVRVRKLLVAVELALAVVLLSGAGLMLKSFWRMNAHPPGFEPERILVMKVALSGPQYRDVVRQRAYADELLRRLQPVLGVEAAGITTPSARSSIAVEGSPNPAPGQSPLIAVFNVTSAGSAKVMGARLVRGRWFTDAEPEPVVAINETLARQEFGTSDPIGRRIRMVGAPRPGVPPVVTIVGVIADLKYSKLDRDPEPEWYIPYRIAPDLSGITVMVKMNADPLKAAPAIRKLVSEVDKGLPAFDVMTMEQAMADSIAPRRFNLILLGMFAIAALFLALIGIYGVISFSVAQRSHEIGVRMALGAERSAVVRMVVRQGMGISSVGIVAGMVAAAGLTRFIESLLYDVKPTDAQTFAAVALVLTVTALAACCVPALKAAFVDPIIALRYE
jgi:putative ABC transport system permease protein